VSLVRTYLGLGANVGDAPATLAWAVRQLGSEPDVRVRDVSRLYRTRPVGVEDQPDFHNAALALDVRVGADPGHSALVLLERLKALERGAGRRDGRRWGPRELDLDLLVFGRHRIHVAREEASRSAATAGAGPQWLDVPHVAAAQRAFVLAPLADLAPGLVPPGWGASVATALRHRLMVEGDAAVRPVATWDVAIADWRPLAEGQPVASPGSRKASRTSGRQPTGSTPSRPLRLPKCII
jgi:2-amino-4-hydroxy-6-hydroxymethyldihydropteridine diphosphokinase